MIPDEFAHWIARAIEGLVLLWEVLDAADLENRVCLLPSMLIYSPKD